MPNYERYQFILLPDRDQDLIEVLTEIKKGPHGALTQHIKAALRAFEDGNTCTAKAAPEPANIDYGRIRRVMEAVFEQYASRLGEVQPTHQHDAACDDETDWLLDSLGAALILTEHEGEPNGDTEFEAD
jgi:hypothetical protein